MIPWLSVASRSAVGAARMGRLLLASLLAWLAPAAAAPAADPQEIQWFDTPAEALGPLLSQKPRVLAFGEYHQTHKTTAVRSSLRRFIDEMLPHMLYWPTDLIVETWVPAGDCGTQEKAVVKDVRKTTQRPKKTESEIVTLLREASQRGIRPHILEIPCAEYRAVLGGDGEVDYDRLLVMLTKQLARKVTQVRSQRDESSRPILVYGGALHNDLYPKEEFRNYTFGPQLLRELGGKYLEVDLLVPQFVDNDRDIRAEPWFARYQREARPGKTALVRRGPNSYVILFPRGR